MTNALIENREVTWNVLGIPVYGTITEPADKKTRGAVIFVAGSGPTDRDWCSPLLPGTNGSARLLAEALADQGFCTLRYDKIASGPHVRENFSAFSGRLSMQTHTDELAGAVETIVSEKNVDKDDLFVFGNSEGTIHAVNYQLQAKSNRFRGLVLTGAPGQSIGEVGRTQIAGQVKSIPGAETIMNHYDEAIAAFIAGKPMVIDSSLPEGVQQLLHSLESPVNLPFSKELWAYNLPEYVAKVNEPVLVVIGKKDLQIDWEVDGKALEKATAKKPSVTFAYPENANHVLKHEETPRENLTAPYVMEHYNATDAVLDDEATNTIFSWLKKLRRI